jgi:thymidylate synthase (FAD)
MNVRPISITAPLSGAIPGLPDGASPEAVIVYTARASSPENQTKHLTGARLLSYCIAHGHWSVFEMVDVTFEIETSRAIAAQILRHRSFSFQEFSQRYSAVSKLGDLVEPVEMRAKHVEGNRQGSGENIGWMPIPHASYSVNEIAGSAVKHAEQAYNELLSAGVAPECARMVLPLATKTRLYMKGSVRSWIHYLQVRCDSHAQKEHRIIADAVKGHFTSLFPIISEALWPKPEPENQPAA